MLRELARALGEQQEALGLITHRLKSPPLRPDPRTRRWIREIGSTGYTVVPGFKSMDWCASRVADSIGGSAEGDRPPGKIREYSASRTCQFTLPRRPIMKQFGHVRCVRFAISALPTPWLRVGLQAAQISGCRPDWKGPRNVDIQAQRLARLHR